MADVNITLEAATKEFTASMLESKKAADQLSTQLGKLKDDHAKLVAAAKENTTAVSNQTAQTQKLSGALQGLQGAGQAGAISIGLAVTAFQALYDIAKATGEALVDVFKKGVTNIDDFQRATIGTAAAITNLADQSKLSGQTYEQVFHRNLEATKQTFVDLEKLSSKYFASAIDLQLAYNTFAQRGIIIRREELPLLAELTSQILLLTQGQASTIQVQQEIRDFLNGNVRTSAALSQLLKAFGADIKDIGQQIRITGSLKPLESILVGARAATTEIQQVFTAAKNGLDTTIRQIGRLGLDQFYAQLVSQIRQFTDYLNTNKVQIVGLLAAIGKAAGDVLGTVGKATQDLLGLGNQTKTNNTQFIDFIALVETSLETMIAAVQSIVNLLGLLPPVLKEVSRLFTGAFELDPAVKQLKEQQAFLEDTIANTRKNIEDLGKSSGPGTAFAIKAENDLLTVQTQQLENVRRLLIDTYSASAPLLTRIKDVLFTTTGNLPSALSASKGTINDWSNGVEAAFNKVHAALDPLIKSVGSFGLRLNANRQELLGAQIVGQGQANFQLNQPAATEQPTRGLFNVTEEDQQKQTHAINTLISAWDRYYRAIRTAAEAAVAATIQANLVALQRDAQLTAQGFDHIGTAILGLKTTANEVTKFIGKNIEAFVTGAKADFLELENNVAQVNSDIADQTIKNLDTQLAVLTKGFEHFKTTAESAKLELRKTEVDPHNDAAAIIEDRANAAYKAQTQVGAKLIADAEAHLKVAQEEKDTVKEKAALEELESARNKADDIARLATLELNKQLTIALLEKRTAVANGLRLDAQEQLQITTEGLRVEREKQLVLEKQAALVGIIFQKNQQALDTAQQEVVNAKRQLPRTDLEAGRAEIQTVVTKLEANIGEAEQRLTTTSNLLDKAIASGNPEQIQALTEAFVAAGGAVYDLKERLKEYIKVANQANDRKVADAAIGNAVRGVVNGLATALTDAFEGKRTNFAQLFKGVSDQLFKDSLKNLTQGLEKSFQNAFDDLARTIAPNMVSTLGPAFLAGFALLASFLLGQVLQKNNTSSTAGNPTVGIQSSEQVRGLIGGETQIPIGQIGESLQNALVPTNVLLARIARAVEGMASGGSLNETQIDALVTRSVNEALQIQPA